MMLTAAGPFTVHSISPLSSDEGVLDFVMARYRIAQDEGEFIRERSGPTGTESCALLRVNGTAVGFATYYEPETEYHQGLMWLDLLWVAPAWRRRGGGNLLVGHVLEEAREAACTRVGFGTQAWNLAMQGLGRRHGFVANDIGFRAEVGYRAEIIGT